MNKQFRVKLIVRRAPALAALSWLKQSWAVFLQAPLCWILMFVTLGLLALLSQIHEVSTLCCPDHSYQAG